MEEGLKTQVFHQLSIGRHTAIPGRILAQRLGYKTDRTIRQAILELIKDGVPIIGCSTPPYGYYISSSVTEIKTQMEVLKGYIVELAKHRRDLKLCIRTVQHEKQLTMI